MHVDSPHLLTEPHSSFGLESNMTTLKKFIGSMNETLASGVPAYVFQSVPSNSPILRDVVLPGSHLANLCAVSLTSRTCTGFMDERSTGIEPQVVQFYLGPAGSGAPIHFHEYARNLASWDS